MCKVTSEKKQEIFSEKNKKDMKVKTKESVNYMIPLIENDSQLSSEQKEEYIKILRDENNALGEEPQK